MGSDLEGCGALRVSNGFFMIFDCWLVEVWIEVGGKRDVFAYTKYQNQICGLFYHFKFPSHLTSPTHRLSMVKRRWRQLAGESSETFSSPSDGATVTSCRSRRATTLSDGNLRRDGPVWLDRLQVFFWEANITELYHTPSHGAAIQKCTKDSAKCPSSRYSQVEIINDFAASWDPPAQRRFDRTLGLNDSK